MAASNTQQATDRWVAPPHTKANSYLPWASIASQAASSAQAVRACVGITARTPQSSPITSASAYRERA